MNTMSEFEDRMNDLLAERLTGDGDRRPVVAWVLCVVHTDPETMREESVEFITPDGQSSLMSRGLVEAARDELAADNVGSVITPNGKTKMTETARDIAEAIRRSCTLPSDVVTQSADRIVLAVADWIENPPEWVKASWVSNGDH